MTQDSITSHVNKSNVHRELSKKDKNKQYREMMPYVDVSTVGRKENVQLEKDFSKMTGIK